MLFIIVLKQYDQQTHDIKKETFKSESTLQLVIQREGALKRIYSKGDLLEKNRILHYCNEYYCD